MVKGIQPIDYSSRDYSSLVADLQASAPLLLPEWTSRSDLDFGTVLIEEFAYVGDILNYYIDRVANEMFLATATRRQSVLNIARMLNYTPLAQQSASVQLTFTLIATSGEVTIPSGSRVSTLPQAGSTPIVFETSAALTIIGNSGTTPVYTDSVAAVQGITTTDEVLTASATGGPSQTYTLFNPRVITSSIVIDVLDATGIETQWTEVPNLFTQTAGARVYEQRVDENDIVHILFGDNVSGFAPSLGAVVKATYRVGEGTAGNVVAGRLTEMVSPIVGIQSVTNLSAAGGGVDAESLDSIRTNIPVSLGALQRAVTLADYAALAVQVSGIAKAQATATVYTSVLLYIAPTGLGGQAATGPDTSSGTQKFEVQDYFSDKKLVNVTITLADPTYIDINIDANIFVLDNFYQPTVQNAVSSALISLLDYDNVNFGQDITISQVYHAIQDVTGVDYVSVTLLVRDDATTQAGVNDIAIGTGEIPQKGAGTFTLVMSGGVL